jgi:poly(hydroxyalkanoate) granule-associated protein
MATELENQVKKQFDDVTESAHQLFLAGLGAAALAEQEGSKLFGQLVTRGRKVEAEGRKRLDKGKKQLTEATKRAGKAVGKLQGELDSRLSKVVQRLGIPNQDQIRLLTERVAELTRKVEGLQKVSTKSAQAG